MPRLVDWIENQELGAEADAEDRALPDGRWQCFCGRIFDPNSEGGTVSASPWAPVVCGECLPDRAALAATEQGES